MNDANRTDPLDEIANRSGPWREEDLKEVGRVVAALRLAVPARRTAVADPDLVSRIVDGEDPTGATSLDPTQRAATAAVARILDRAAPTRSHHGLRLWAAAAVAALLIIGVALPGTDPLEHRAPARPSSATPDRLAAGDVEGGLRLAWGGVIEADRYEVTVFDSTGAVLLLTSTTDTAIVVPRHELTQAGTVFWRVRARLDVNRWSESVLAEIPSTLPGRP